MVGERIAIPVLPMYRKGACITSVDARLCKRLLFYFADLCKIGKFQLEENSDMAIAIDGTIK